MIGSRYMVFVSYSFFCTCVHAHGFLIPNIILCYLAEKETFSMNTYTRVILQTWLHLQQRKASFNTFRRQCFDCKIPLIPLHSILKNRCKLTSVPNSVYCSPITLLFFSRFQNLHAISNQQSIRD